jgi:hypothetical protein
MTVAHLTAAGLAPFEPAALDLLTRAPDESYEAHALRIAHAAGPEGAFARVVKLADLADHLAHRELPDAAPPHAWARLHIANAQARRDGADRAAA